jgi:hypothetical protein
VNNPPEHQSQGLRFVLKMSLLIVGSLLFFVLVIGIYLTLTRPKRLVVRRLPDRTSLTILSPQPLQMPLDDTNLLIIEPPLNAYISGAATNAAIWVNGKPFKSGGRAAWELIKRASPLWCTSLGILICLGLLNRRDRRHKA